MSDDDMSVEAKERAFRRARKFTNEQFLWLEAFQRVGERLPKERLTLDAYRSILLHLQVERNDLMRMIEKVGSAPRDQKNLAECFHRLIRQNNAFGDEVLKQKVRELAMSHGVTKEQILAASR